MWAPDPRLQRTAHDNRAAAHTSALQGMTGGYSDDTAWDNVHQWHWVR